MNIRRTYRQSQILPQASLPSLQKAHKVKLIKGSRKKSSVIPSRIDTCRLPERMKASMGVSGAKLVLQERPETPQKVEIRTPKSRQELDAIFDEQLTPGIKANWESVKNEAIAPLTSMRREIRFAKRMFRNAANAKLGFIILGNGDIREDPDLLANVGVVAATPDSAAVTRVKAHRKEAEKKRRGSYDQMKKSAAMVAHLAKGHFHKGSVLVDANWSILRNDALILGGISEGQEFHLAMQEGALPTQENVWNEEYGLRVFGRELAILCLSGYKLHVLPEGRGLLFAPGENVRMPTLQEARDVVAGIKNADQLLDMVKSATVQEG